MIGPRRLFKPCCISALSPKSTVPTPPSETRKEGKFRLVCLKVMSLAEWIFPNRIRFASTMASFTSENNADVVLRNGLLIPDNYHYVIINEDSSSVELRVSLKDANDATSWVRNFEESSSTRWIVQSGRKAEQKRNAFHKYWTCHLSILKGAPIPAKSKKTGCAASLDIKIKHITVNTLKKDKLLRQQPPLNAIVRINFKHNHVQNAAADLQLLRPCDEVKQCFLAYFNDGLSVSQAKQLHESKILLKEDPYTNIANGTINPKLRWVYYQYDLWRKENLGDHVNFLEKIKEKDSAFQEKGAEVHIKEEEGQWAILVVTPVMKRLHSFVCAKEVIFLDSSSSCDTMGSTVTVILAALKAGAIPLCVLIHSNQSEESYLLAFSSLKSNYPNCFGGQAAPMIFMTDDSAAEKNALKRCWPDSNQLLCHFHVSQAEWRWLMAVKNGIAMDRRRYLMAVFQKIMYADTIQKLNDAVAVLNECPESKFVTRVNSFLQRAEEWVSYHRMEKLTRGNNTNNYSEATVRIIKDKVLGRMKAFNVVALVDYIVTVFDEYLSQRVYHVAIGSRSEKEYTDLVERVPVEILSQVKQIDAYSYSVPSVTDSNIIYTVDVQVGLCTCMNGMSGRFCKHQAIVHKKFGGLFPNSPILNTNDRFQLAQLALGNKCPERSFFLGLTDIEEGVENNENSSSDVINVAGNDDFTPDNDIQQNANSIVSTTTGDQNLEVAVQEEERQLNANILNLHGLAERNGNYLKCLKSINSSLRKITTSSAMSEAVINIATTLRGRYRRRIIRVQSTSLARRRPGVTRGSKRIRAGRPACSCNHKPKRPRNLRLNVQKNVANSR